MTSAAKLEGSEGRHADAHAQTVAPEAVQQAMEEIFKSGPFRASRQSQDLLRYIVTHTLSGEDQLLRERVIGAEVFGRKPDYDTGEDPVVRLRASDVRKRLAQFYQGEHGPGLAIKIEIPAGSYRATIERQERPRPSPPVPVEPVTTHPAPSPVVPRRTGALRWAVAAVILALIATLGVVAFRSRENRALNDFWGPLLKDSRPTLICVGSNAVYRLSYDFLQKYQKTHGENHDGYEFLIRPQPGQMMDQGDLLRAPDFVALGDVAANSSIVSFLTKSNKKFYERFPQDMSFAEIQENQSILIGGFNNQMAMTINKNFRFTLEGSNHILDRQNPGKKWILPFDGDAKDSEDFALVSRLVDPVSGHQTVTLGGIGQFGTQAAAEFLTDPKAVADWARTAPTGWKTRNVQMVLHVKVTDYRPVLKEVVVSYVW